MEFLSKNKTNMPSTNLKSKTKIMKLPILVEVDELSNWRLRIPIRCLCLLMKILPTLVLAPQNPSL